MNREDLHVGQRVWVSGSRGRNSAWERGEVRKLGSKLVTIAFAWSRDGEEHLGREHVYRIDTQNLNDKNFGSSSSFKTDEQRERDDHQAEVHGYLKAVGVQFDHWRCKIDFPDRERIADLLKELGYAAEQ